MPFAKMIGPVEKNITKSKFSLFFLDLNFKNFPPRIHAIPRSCCFHINLSGNYIKLQIKKNRKNIHKTMFNAH